MSRIITKRIIPILLLVMLCIGMFPTAFAAAEITMTDTLTATQIEVVQGSSDADITIASNEDAGDLIADEGPDVTIGKNAIVVAKEMPDQDIPDAE